MRRKTARSRSRPKSPVTSDSPDQLRFTFSIYDALLNKKGISRSRAESDKRQAHLGNSDEQREAAEFTVSTCAVPKPTAVFTVLG